MYICNEQECTEKWVIFHFPILEAATKMWLGSNQPISFCVAVFQSHEHECEEKLEATTKIWLGSKDQLQQMIKKQFDQLLRMTEKTGWPIATDEQETVWPVTIDD